MEFKDTKEQVEANLMLRINRNIMEFKDKAAQKIKEQILEN